MKLTGKNFLVSLRCLLPALCLCAVMTACTSPKVKYFDEELGRARFAEPVLVMPPLNQQSNLQKSCKQLGKYYLLAISQEMSGQVTYAGNIESLSKAVMWENIINNGMVNVKEVATIGRTLGCNSVITVRVLEYKQYPPFRMVVDMLWVDCINGSVIARLYDDIDMTDSETNYRFENFTGDGPGRTLYEQFAPYKGISKTAALKPTDFLNFVAYYSSKIMFDPVSTSKFHWRFWRIL